MHEQTLRDKIETMLKLQDEMNLRVDPDWLAKNREWYRAIWIECAELMDHYGGWKWWKHSTADLEQVLLEIVDIWHFGLSMRIDTTRDFASAAEQIAREWRAPLPSRGFLRDVETLACAALAEQRFLIAIIPAMLADIRCGFLDLYRSYVGKNVLNLFRQDHGYKSGTYRKQWDGREDNEHLAEIVASLDVDAPDYREAIHRTLAARYAETAGG